MTGKIDTLSLIEKKIKQFRKSEQKAARFILKYPEKIALLPLRKLAEESEVSEATILRLCRGMGFVGFQDFKISLIPELLNRGIEIREEMKSLDEEGAWKKNISESLMKSVQDSILNIDSKILNKAAQTINTANRVIISGLGGAAGVAHILADSLTGIGILSLSQHDISYLQVLPESLTKNDVLIGVSHSGETDELVRLFQRSKMLDVVTVAITNYEGSPLQRSADLTIYTYVPESYLGSYSCEPRIAELVIVELLLDRISTLRRKQE